jgi:flagellar hook-associated protein 2
MGTVNNYGNVLLAAGSNTIDVQSLLNAAISAAEQPLTLLQNQQSTIQTQSSTLQAIENDITTLSNAVSSLSNTGGGVSALQATSSDSSVLTASADATATAENHSITVNSLATTSTYYTDPVASSSTPIATGSFTLAVGSGTPTTITVDNTNDTLDGLAASINSQNLGVTASVVNDTSGARLALVSNTTGASSNIAITNNTTGLTFNNAVTGANASLVVDGIPITSASNTISGVIPGVTLNLQSANPGETVNVSVAPDTSTAESAINSFVSAWNTVIGDLNTEFAIPASGTAAAPLESDSTLRNIQSQLLSAITYSIGGNGGFVNLASIGLNMNDDGTISVNTNTLDNALASNPTNVQTLMQGASGFATNMSNVMNLITDPTQGLVTLDLQGMSQTNQDLSNQITQMESSLQTEQQNLTSQFDQMQVALQEMPQIQSEISQQLAGLS